MGTTKNYEHKNDMKKKNVFGRLIRHGCGRFGGGEGQFWNIFHDYASKYV